MRKLFTTTAAGGLLAVGFGGLALADSIDPDSYSTSLMLGESKTITKTVVVSADMPEVLLDVMFLVDTTGSMSAEIAAAKDAADDILSGLAAEFGPDLAAGTGWYSDPSFAGVASNLTTDAAAASAAIGALPAATGGGDFPELGNAAIKEAAENATWRPGSNRFIIALGDASFKDLEAGTTDAEVIAALSAKSINLIGLDYCSGTQCTGLSDPDASENTFAAAIASLGGSSSTSTPESIVDDIIDSISASFASYTAVTVDDFNAGMPGVDVSVACVSADIGDCVGATAVGDYDRSEDRTFTFDVTFTGLEEGMWTFDTWATVDGGGIAREIDNINVVVPLPAAGWMMLSGIVGGFGLLRRRRKS